MTDENITPQDTNIPEDNNKSGLLASRWDRLGASFIDGILTIPFVVPIIYFIGYDNLLAGIKTHHNYSLIMNVIGILIFIILHSHLLMTSGQTIGKKFFGIKIVDINGNLPKTKENLLKRYAFYFIPGMIPVIGGLISTANILFIFRNDQRCIHDLIAGTKVVNC